MVDAAARSPPAVLAAGQMRRFLFVNRWVKMLIEHGALGDVESFDVREGECFHLRRVRGNPRAAAGTGQFSPAFWDRKTSGGGVLPDIGSHTLDTLIWWLGSGKVAGYRDDSPGGVESDALIELELRGGAAGTVELSRTRTLRNTAILTGSRGRVEVALHRNEIVGISPEDLLLRERDGRNGAAMPDESLLHEDMFRRELDDWLGAVRGAGVPLADGASVAPGIGIIDRCYCAADRSEPERLAAPEQQALAAEREIIRMIREDGLRATVIRPTIVYGPFSRHWTDHPADMLIDGALILPAPGDGICNAVYVDDVVSALLLAACRDAARGETFLVSGPDHPTWLDFYGACARALGREGALRTMAYDELERRVARRDGLPALLAPRRLLAHRPLRPLRRVLRSVYRRLGDGVQAKARRFYERGLVPSKDDTDGMAGLLPPKRRLDLYTARCVVRIDKARRLLGYEPEFDLERGMERTTRYLHWAYGHRTQGSPPTA